MYSRKNLAAAKKKRKKKYQGKTAHDVRSVSLKSGTNAIRKHNRQLKDALGYE